MKDTRKVGGGGRFDEGSGTEAAASEFTTRDDRMLGMSAVLNGDTSPAATMVQTDVCYTMSAEAFRQEMERRGAFGELLPRPCHGRRSREARSRLVRVLSNGTDLLQAVTRQRS